MVTTFLFSPPSPWRSDPDLDALISDLKRVLTDVDPTQPKMAEKASGSHVSLSDGNLAELAELIAERVFARFQTRMPA